MNKPQSLIESGKLRSNKPKAVLVYQEKDILVEGLIFGEEVKCIEYENDELKNFEYNYCKECSLYRDGDEYPPDIHELQTTLLSALKHSGYSDTNDEREESAYNQCVDSIERLFDVEGVEGLINKWQDKPEDIFGLCCSYLEEYICDFNSWHDRKEERTCDGGISVLHDEDCEYHSLQDFGDNYIYEVGLPSHIWIKLSNLEYPTSFEYLLLGLIDYKGYIMPPLAIGNVWSSLRTFQWSYNLGMICWGYVNPSSNIKTAYNQFWNSVFNYDNVGSNIYLDKSKEYGKLMLKGIKEEVDKDNPINQCYTNNIILKDGKFKPGVIIHKL